MLRTFLFASSLAVFALAPAFAGDPKPAPPTGGDAASMAKAHQHDSPVPTEMGQVPPASEVPGSEVAYATIAGQRVHGYLARPAASGGPWPGLILIHEWWGLNDNIRGAARRLGAQGYMVLAVDLYGGRQTTVPDEAQKMMQAVDPTAARENLRQAYAYLATQQKSPRVGIMGWCFGGGWALQGALEMPDKLAALVMYYGRVETDPAKLKPLQMPILGIFGAADQAIPVADVHNFEAALKTAGRNATIKIYDGVGHAFANPSGTNYKKEPAEDAWKRTLEFLTKNLKK